MFTGCGTTPSSLDNYNMAYLYENYLFLPLTCCQKTKQSIKLQILRNFPNQENMLILVKKKKKKPETEK